MRLRRLEGELGNRLRLRRKSFVLVTEGRGGRTFTDYHRAHREAAAWVREREPALFPAFDLALFEAFFGRVEDISDPAVLARIAAAIGLDPAPLGQALAERSGRGVVLDEYREAVDRGVRGIPAILIAGRDPIIGAVSHADLRQAVAHGLDQRTGAAGAGDRVTGEGAGSG